MVFAPPSAPLTQGSRWEPHILLGMGGEEGEELSWGAQLEGFQSFNAWGGFRSPWWCCVCQTLVFEGEPGCFGSVGIPWPPQPPGGMGPCSSASWMTWAHLMGAEVEQRGASHGQISLQSPWPFVACSQSSPRRDPDPAQTWQCCPQHCCSALCQLQPPALSTGLLGA